MGGKLVSKIRFLSSRVLTLSYPKYRFFIFLVVLILLGVLPFSVVEKTHNFSICSAVLGEFCFSVGITRGVSSLLRGNFDQAVEFNFLAVPVLLILVGFIGYDFYKGFIKSKK